MNDKYIGTDTDLETSLIEYGFIMTQNEHCENEDEWLCIYKLNTNVYDFGYIRESELDALMTDKDEWVKTEDVLSFVSMTLKEWLEMSVVSKVSDLLSYYGYENIFGSSYNPNDLKWVNNTVGLNFTEGD